MASTVFYVVTNVPTPGIMTSDLEAFRRSTGHENAQVHEFEHEYEARAYYMATTGEDAPRVEYPRVAGRYDTRREIIVKNENGKLVRNKPSEEQIKALREIGLWP